MHESGPDSLQMTNDAAQTCIYSKMCRSCLLVGASIRRVHLYYALARLRPPAKKIGLLVGKGNEGTLKGNSLMQAKSMLLRAWDMPVSCPLGAQIRCNKRFAGKSNLPRPRREPGNESPASSTRHKPQANGRTIARVISPTPEPWASQW